MSVSFKTPSAVFQAEIVEKKSRFIATLSPAASEEEAQAFVRAMKKQYWDARHNCSAYIIGTGPQILHSSDDGEPSGTAGKPILSVLSGNGLYNAVVVVTRYFGGTLLGTGGLVRAYSGAVEKCLASAELKEMMQAAQIKIEASYTDAGKLQYLFAQKNAVILSSEYTDRVTFTLLVPRDAEAGFLKEVSENTQNRAAAEVLARDWFAF